ncbi:MAG: HD domain-containing protein [Dehalococcoidia bacterium]
MAVVPSIAEAESLAEELLAPLGNRWLHTQAVAVRAQELADAVPDEDRDLLVVAAWLHDIGYARDVVDVGFHPIDGARFLARRGADGRLCALVAHHSAATIEAEERGLAAELAEWEREEGPVPDALWTADMTTGPRGEHLTYADRLAEIISRYRPESAVAQAMRRARPLVDGAIERTTRGLSG